MHVPPQQFNGGQPLLGRAREPEEKILAGGIQLAQAAFPYYRREHTAIIAEGRRLNE